MGYTVKEWFANKIANEVKRNITMCEVFAILKETDKAVYAMLNLGCDFHKTMWLPKSVMIENDNINTIHNDNYDECVKLFKSMWNDYK